MKSFPNEGEDMHPFFSLISVKLLSREDGLLEEDHGGEAPAIALSVRENYSAGPRAEEYT